MTEIYDYSLTYGIIHNILIIFSDLSEFEYEPSKLNYVQESSVITKRLTCTCNKVLHGSGNSGMHQCSRYGRPGVRDTNCRALYCGDCFAKTPEQLWKHWSCVFCSGVLINYVEENHVKMAVNLL